MNMAIDLEKIIEGAADYEDGETGMSRCVELYCKDRGIDEQIAEKAYQIWFTREARGAGIPLSVIEGKTKLSDHFSSEYIESQIHPKNTTLGSANQVDSSLDAESGVLSFDQD